LAVLFVNTSSSSTVLDQIEQRILAVGNLVGSVCQRCSQKLHHIRFSGASLHQADMAVGRSNRKARRVMANGTSGEIEATFATLGRERADALFVANDALFTSRRVQFALLAVRHAIPAIYSTREYHEVERIMS
jgi:hypothetical protein